MIGRRIGEMYQQITGQNGRLSPAYMFGTVGIERGTLKERIVQLLRSKTKIVQLHITDIWSKFLITKILLHII